MLENPDFKLQFQSLYEKLSRLADEYEDRSEWWQLLAKPAIVVFCKDFSSKLAKERRSTKAFLHASLKCFLKTENWVEVARTKQKLKQMMLSDSQI